MIAMKSVYWNDVDEVWPDMERHLEMAEELSRGALTAGAIKKALQLRDMQALVAVDEDDHIIGVAVTEIRKAATGMRILHVVALAGDRFDEWEAESNRVIRGWAKSEDTPIVQLIGRRGWTRRLAQYGWKEDAVLMTLDLRN